MVQAVWYATASSPIDPLAIAGKQRQLLLNRLLLVEAGLARVEQRFAQDSPLEGDGFELPVPRHGSLSCLHISWAEPCEADIIIYRSPYKCFPLEKTGCNPS
jgi:hypothetical protein